MCGAYRPLTGKGEGFCGLPALPGICRADKHMWEEPDISGERGSGTVFFSGCVLRCEFCQNSVISRNSCGKTVNAQELADIFKRLESEGVHNINLVSPTPYYPVITEALDIYRPAIPIVCNTSGYERVETLKRLEGYIDIYLPDFKYSSAEAAKKYSAAPDYPAVTLAAIKEMVRQVGIPVHSDDGMMKKGVMIRHLILPDNVENSLGVLDMIADELPQDIYVSLMAQYFPTGNETHTELGRKITKEEYDTVSSYMMLLGLENGYMQEHESADSSYVPDWNMI
ncbi:MAG: radical SAM protein [Clostridia bacterium]|nr:radical SAM protein [Clostridia bacterium]